jgi:hypothetical protein
MTSADRFNEPLNGRVARRQFWKNIMLYSMLAMLVVMFGLVIAGNQMRHYFKPAMIILTISGSVFSLSGWRMSVCPGCRFRIYRTASEWCPYCGMHLSSGSPGPRQTPTFDAPSSPVLECPKCHHAPGRHRSVSVTVSLGRAVLYKLWGKASSLG